MINFYVHFIYIFKELCFHKQTEEHLLLILVLLHILITGRIVTFHLSQLFQYYRIYLNIHEGSQNNIKLNVVIRYLF